MSGLRVVTWNIHHGVGQDGRLSTARIAGNLAALDADVVGLQEVDRAFDARSAWADQAAELADALGLHLHWAPAIRRRSPAGGRSEGEYGVALLTRGPSRLVAVRPLVVPGREPRVLLHAAVDLPGQPGLDVLVTHLDFSSGPARRAQASGIAETPLRGPAVVLADLNARPGARELAPLSGWADAWAAAAERSGGSWPLGDAVATALPPSALTGWAAHLVGRTQPARFPVRRVDAVLVRGGVRARRAAVVDVGGSDHRPLVVDVTVG